MKVAFKVIFLFLFLHSALFAQNDFLRFPKDNFLELSQKASFENKPVMLYFDLDGCLPCLEMENAAFKNDTIIAFLKEHFIYSKVNGKKGEGPQLANLYAVENYPTFIFLDSHNHILHKSVGFFTPYDFLKELKKALSSKESLSYFQAGFKSGNRSASFLYSYCYALSNVNEDYSPAMNAYFKMQSHGDLKSAKNIKFIYDLAVDKLTPRIVFGSKEFDFLYSEKKLFYKYFEKNQVDARIVVIVNDEIEQAIEEKNETRFNKAIEYIKPFDNGQVYEVKKGDIVTGRISTFQLILSSKMSFYKNSGNFKKYHELSELFRKAIWDNYHELYEYAKVMEDFENDPDELKTAIEYIKRAIELKESYLSLDLYANLLYKIGSYADALLQAEKAIEMAKANQINFDQTTLLMDNINRKSH